MLKGRLGPDDDALLLLALEAARELVREEAHSAGEERRDLSAERSDALGKLAESWLAHGPGELAGGERRRASDTTSLPDAPGAPAGGG